MSEESKNKKLCRPSYHVIQFFKIGYKCVICGEKFISGKEINKITTQKEKLEEKVKQLENKNKAINEEALKIKQKAKENYNSVDLIIQKSKEKIDKTKESSESVIGMKF